MMWKLKTKFLLYILLPPFQQGREKSAALRQSMLLSCWICAAHVLSYPPLCKLQAANWVKCPQQPNSFYALSQQRAAPKLLVMWESNTPNGKRKWTLPNINDTRGGRTSQLNPWCLATLIIPWKINITCLNVCGRVHITPTSNHIPKNMGINLLL